METILISEIKMNERFRKTVGSISSLVESIKEVGLLHPIVISEKNELIAGWRRIKAFELLGRTEIPCHHVNLTDLRNGEVQENMVRKDFTTSEMVAVKRALEPEVVIGQGKRTDLTSSNLDEVPHRTDDKLASFVGVGKDTLRKAEVIVEAAEKEPEKFGSLLSKVDNKETSVNAAYNKIQQTNSPKDFKPKVFNVWNFQSCDPRFGIEQFKGRIPGQIVQNVLHYFTEEGDLVVDPMAGSGTTLDVCKVMNRKALCSDKTPVLETIINRDIQKDGYLPEAEGCNLVFLDPPYFDMVFDLYANVEEFYTFVKKLAEDTYKILKKDGHVAFLIADNTKQSFLYLRGTTYETFKSLFGEPVAVISVPLTTEQANLNEILNARKYKKLLGRDRTLFIFKK